MIKENCPICNTKVKLEKWEIFGKNNFLEIRFKCPNCLYERYEKVPK